MGLLFNIPVVTTRHYLERRKKYNILYFLEDVTLRWSDAVIAISPAVNKHLIRKGFSIQEKCKTIYNPMNVSLLRSDNAIPLTDRNTIVCNARFIPLKGLKYLVDAFTKIGECIPGSKLVLIGPFDSGNPVLPLIKKHAYSDRIHVKGRLLREEIIQELSRTRIYVQPSLSEGLGLAAVEAMGMECPCVFSDVGGLKDLSNDGQNAVTVPPRNSRALAEEIIGLWNDVSKSKQLGTNAKNFIYTKFDSTIIAPQYLQVYKEIVHD
jgi:glycosyltransferase involved in cell wall biosynthesis